MKKYIKYFLIVIAFIIIPLFFIYGIYKINEERTFNMQSLYSHIMKAPVLVSDEKTFQNRPDIQERKLLTEKIGEMQNYSQSMIRTIEETGNAQERYYDRFLNIYYDYNIYANRLQNESKINKYTSMEYLNKVMRAYYINPELYKKNTQIDNVNAAWVLLAYLISLTILVAIRFKKKLSKIYLYKIK